MYRIGLLLETIRKSDDLSIVRRAADSICRFAPKIPGAEEALYDVTRDISVPPDKRAAVKDALEVLWQARFGD